MTNNFIAIIIGFIIGEINLVLFFLSMSLAKKHSEKAMNYIVGGYAVKFLFTLILLVLVLFFSGLPQIPMAISFLVITLVNLIIEITILMRKKS